VSDAATIHHRILIVGGGSAGISVAARLRRAGMDDVAVLDPADTHYYQPLWTLVGGGRAPVKESARPQASVMPAWRRLDQGQRRAHRPRQPAGDLRLRCPPGLRLPRCLSRHPARLVHGLGHGRRTRHPGGVEQLHLRPGTQDLGGHPAAALGDRGVHHAGRPIKCAGAPQKIAYLAADHWRREGVLGDIRIVLVLPTPGMFGVVRALRPGDSEGGEARVWVGLGCYCFPAMAGLRSGANPA